MAEQATKPTLLDVPPEVRLEIYQHLFKGSQIIFCSLSFSALRCVLSGHGYYTSKPISHRHLPNQLTAVCRKLRNEALPVLLKNVKLVCCHLLDTSLPGEFICDRYLQNIRKASVCRDDIHPATARRVTKLPSLPALRTLEVDGLRGLLLGVIRDADATVEPCLSRSSNLGRGTATTLWEREIEVFRRASSLGGYQDVWGFLFHRNAARAFRTVVKASTFVVKSTPGRVSKQLEAHFDFDVDDSKISQWRVSTMIDDEDMF